LTELSNQYEFMNLSYSSTGRPNSFTTEGQTKQKPVGKFFLLVLSAHFIYNNKSAHSIANHC